MRKIIILLAPLFALSVGAQTQPNYAAQVNAAHPSVVLDFNDATTSFREHISGVTFAPSSSGTITPRFAGFDADSPSNTSAKFTYNSYIVAPNDTIGDLEWSQPFSIQIHLDNLQASRSADEPIAAKGRIAPFGNNGHGYLMFLHWDSGNSKEEFCAEMEMSGGYQNLTYDVCTNFSSDMPNGYNYNVVWTHDGTGSPTGDHIYVNATEPNGGALVTASNGQPGEIKIVISGSGSGYASGTAFTASGGGSNCHVVGAMASTSGVPASISYTSNYGCTSAPTITLTSPTGTGVVLTPTQNAATISSSTTDPLYIMGYDAAAPAGFGTSGNSPLTIDEFAEYPSIVDQYLIQGTFVHTKWYQALIFAKPAVPLPVIYSNDGGADMDNIFSLQVAIAAHLRGYVKLIAVSSDDGGVGGKFYREMLDAAGLHHVPVTAPSVLYTADVVIDPTVVSGYNTNVQTTFPNDVTVLRTALAALPSGQKAVFLFGGPDRILTDLLQSTADGISSLDGADLFAAKVAGVYYQGVDPGYPFSGVGINDFNDPTSGAYVFTHNGSVPLNFYGGSPSSAGPGALHTHIAADPLRQLITFNGQESRECFDCLPTVNFLTTFFQSSPTCGTVTMNVSTGLLSGSSATCSQHWLYPMGPAVLDLYGAQFFPWFVNSLVNVSPEGRPRPN